MTFSTALRPIRWEKSASAALVASIVHYGQYSIADLKAYMAGAGVAVRTI